MEQSVKERLTTYLRSKGISKAEFGRRIGVSSAYVTSIRRSIDKEKMRKITAEFPDINPAWLLFGEGEMIKDSVVQDVSGHHNIAAGHDATVNGGLSEEMTRLLAVIESQQRTIETLSGTVDSLSRKLPGPR